MSKASCSPHIYNITLQPKPSKIDEKPNESVSNQPDPKEEILKSRKLTKSHDPNFIYRDDGTWGENTFK